MTNQSQQYCLRWNNHKTNFTSVMVQLLKSEALTDVTISVDDNHSIKCHKIILAACSTYFQEIFIKNPCEHPMVILSDVKYREIQAILEYMYCGEVNVAADDLENLLKVARFLKVKGLISENEIQGKYENPELDQEPTARSLPMLATAAAVAAAQAAAAASSGCSAANGYPSSPPHVAAPFSVPFGQSPIDGHSAMALWPTAALSGLHQLPQHPISGHQPPARSSFHAGSYDALTDTSPLSRKKMSSYMAHRDTPILRNVLGGQNGSSMSERQETYSSHSNGSAHDLDRRNSSEQSEPMVDEEEKPSTPHTPHKHGLQKEQKPEWKRYKQYTRQHMVDAMSAVDNKEMSALQAAAKYGIPSRTLYDKLKKAGILPTRGSGNQRSSSRSESFSAGSARFPYSSSMNGSVYGGASTSNGVAECEAEASGYGAHADSQNAAMSLAQMTLAVGDLNRGGSVEDMEARSSSNNGQASSNEDSAEDLSVASRRSSDHSVIVPPSIKEEDDETSMQEDDS